MSASEGEHGNQYKRHNQETGEKNLDKIKS